MKKKYLRILDYSIARLLIFIDFILRKVFSWHQFLPRLHDKIETKQYYIKKINNKKITFFCPSATTLYRVDTLFEKEPETLKWIDGFKEYKSKKIVFWDIGANIGIYSIYAAIKFKNIKINSFEPSTSNTRTLSRNISINKLYDKISIFPLALSNKKNIISFFNETKFAEGGSISSFDNNFDQIGNTLQKNRINNRYNTFGTTIDYLIINNIIDCPNYIKIDVDGIEHFILQGAINLLQNNKLRELSIEMTPSYLDQFETINNIMKENNFKNIISTNARLVQNDKYKLEANETVNTIFKRIDNK